MQPHIFSNIQSLGESAASYVAQAVEQAVRERGRFTVAISGGSLPKLVFPPLLVEPLRSQISWAAWHVFWADERCVPLDHAESNYRLAKEILFDHVPIPANQIYAINPALSPNQAADAYQLTLAKVFDLSLTQVEPAPRFDLILLGMGPDGHTASLFPNHVLLNERERWVSPITDSPKPPPERITLTLPTLNNARHVAFIVTGASKAEALAQIENQPNSPPAGMVQPRDGQLDWFVDQPAANRLTS